MTQGQGGFKVGEYATFEEVKEAYLEGIERGDGSYGVKNVEGNWIKIV